MIRKTFLILVFISAVISACESPGQVEAEIGAATLPEPEVAYDIGADEGVFIEFPSDGESNPGQPESSSPDDGITYKIVDTGQGKCYGDINQIDHPYLGISSNGLSTLIDKMQGQKIYAHIDLQKGERSELAELASNIL